MHFLRQGFEAEIGDQRLDCERRKPASIHVAEGCRYWNLRMGANFGSRGWVSILDLEDGCQYWISRMVSRPTVVPKNGLFGHRK